MNKVLGSVMLLLVVAAAIPAQASPALVPEIDSSTGVSAMALLAGAVLVFQARRKSR